MKGDPGSQISIAIVDDHPLLSEGIAAVLSRRENYLVVETGGSVADIAGRTGFADQSHMTRLFIRAYGMSPGVYAAAMEQAAISFKTWHGEPRHMVRDQPSQKYAHTVSLRT